MRCDTLALNGSIDWIWISLILSLASVLILSILLWRTRQKMQQLQIQEERLRLAIEAVGMGVWDVDLLTNREVWSATSETLFGFAPGTYDGKLETFYERVHPEDRAFVQTTNEKALQTGGSQFDFRVVHPDQSVHWLGGIIRVVYDKTGKPVRMLGVDIDITERKRIELALAQSEAQFRSLIDNLPFEVWAIDRDRRCIIQNPLDQLRWGDIVGQQLADIPVPSLGIKHTWQREDERVFAGEVLEIEEQAVIDGEFRSYTKIIAPIHQGNQVTGLLGVNIDITERKQAEEQIKQLNQALETQNRNLETLVKQRTEELESFSYSVSHDLRAPLRHISGFVIALQQELLRNGYHLSPKAEHYLDVIQTSSKKMGLLIDGLLSLSRLGRRQMEMANVPLRPLVEQVLTSLLPETDTSSPLEVKIGDLPTVQGDAVLLQQVFSNLLNNAIKFSRHNPQPVVEVKHLTDGTIVIQDNGVGFSMDYADKLFGAFQRLHSEREFEGTGIGLAIVQRIIHRHNGKIWVESALGQGAKFYLKLEAVV